MAKRAFFSFHYANDITRAQAVRNSWITHADRESAGFFDASIREEAKSKSDAALRQVIANGLKRTSVTVVLLGAETASRKWVKYEIAESIGKGNGLVGIRVHNMKDLGGQTSAAGTSPFDLEWTLNDKPLNLSSVPVHDWVLGNGYKNLGSWIAGAYVAT